MSRFWEMIRSLWAARSSEQYAPDLPRDRPRVEFWTELREGQREAAARASNRA